MVTAEFAMALPAFVIVVVAAVAGVAVVTAQLRCADAAAAAARLAARGESAAVIRTTALAGAPSGSQVSIVTTGDTVTATVRARIEPPGPLSFLPGVTLQADVVDAREPSATGTMP